MKTKKLLLTALSLIIQNTVAAENNLSFNPAFLSGENLNSADLAWVNTGSTLPPGDYNLNVYINTNYAFTGNVKFSVAENTSGEVLPCITSKQLSALGIDSQQAKLREKKKAKQCIFITQAFKDSQFDFDQKTLTLRFTVPQSAMRNLPRGYVSPESWDVGIPSASFNYVINGSNNQYQGETRTREQQLFLSLNSGINLGAWRLRDFSTWTKDTHELTHVQTWLQRDISSLNAQAYAGETYTSSQLFDSIGLRGISLKTDDSMLPNSLSGYAPEVRGIARSNATVTVRQNSNIIYQTSVSPGPFVLKDLYPTSSGGDLAITIQENDGSKTKYMIPYASVPNLVRNGQVKYALGAGKYRSTNNQDTPSLAQGELFYGWRYGLTIYGGLQFSERYHGIAFGVGQNLGHIGAYSIDLTHAQSQLADNNSYSGDSLRLRYSKLLNNIGTRINFFSLRYSTKGFYTLSDTTYKGMSGGKPKQTIEENGTITSLYENVYNLHMSRKAKNQLLLSQPIDQYGSLSLSWDKQTYWNTPKSTQSLQLSWNATFSSFSLGASLQRSNNLYDNKIDNILAMSLSIPLGNPSLSTRAHFTSTHSDATGTTNTTGISGYLPAQKDLFYSVNQRYSAQQRYGGDASLQYEGAWGDYNLGYSYGKDSSNLSYGINGGAVLHENGLTLSQPLGNTNILVKAPGASNVAVLNHKGIKTDNRGYAVIPYATPYRVNQIALDVTTVGNDIELENSIVNKTPTDGALVRATLKTLQGAKAMFIVRHNNEPLPFGTMVTLNDEKSGIVGDGGSLYIIGLATRGTLKAVWGRGSDQSCTISYALNKQSYNVRTGLYSQEVICR